MRTAYEGMFAALFEWNLARWSGNEDMASSLTALGLGYVVSMNGMAILGIVSIVRGPLSAFSPAVLGILGVSPLAVSYLAFVRRKRYLGVVDRFRRRPADEQRRITIGAWTYVGSSLVVELLVLLVRYFHQ